MAQNIKNKPVRLDILKRVLKDLHAGKSVEEVKAEYGTLLAGVDAVEISSLEQMLLDEGVPEEEITAMCDLHVDAFKEALDQHTVPELSPQPSINAYMLENAAMEKLLDQLQATINACDWERSRQLLLELRKFESHYVRKENILFPYLEKHQFTGPSKVMWAIHDNIRKGYKELEILLVHDPDLDKVNQVFQPLAKTMRDMVYKEENILFPAALQMLGKEEWEAIHIQESQPGPAELTTVEPATQDTQSNNDKMIDTKAESAMVDISMIPLRTGKLTLDQVNLLLAHLPVDVTFVDENDEVRYYSDTPRRIFHRAPAIIGRKVQNCHPASSVHRVQRILDEFRSGKRDSADFWIQVGHEEEKKFVYIRYFAVRDELGQYRGTLEVSQDVTGIRHLEGERRLEQDEP